MGGKMSRKCSLWLGLAALALIFSYTPVRAENRPVQIALVTPLQIFPEEDPISGIRFNLIYGRKGRFEGLQWGTVNYAKNMNGLQLGLVNYAESMKGLQLGLVNIIRVGGVLPVLPIVNWSF